MLQVDRLYRDGGGHLTERGERSLEVDLDVIGTGIPEILARLSDRLSGRLVCRACGCLCLPTEVCPGCMAGLGPR